MLFRSAISTAAGLTVGCVIYTLHRAIPYPVLYQLFKWLNHRTESTLELDLQRWRHAANKNAMQHRLGDWAAQVHFLYCIAWATGTSLLIGNALNWKPTPTYAACWWLFAAFAAGGLVHHFRYQRWERRVFQEDAKLPKEAAEPKN